MYSKLMDLFIDWNDKINLSAIRDKDGIKIKHIRDTLEGLKYFRKIIKPGDKIVDVGTGSGFPLLPLAIENPNCNFIGIESVRKKVNAINDIISKLKLNNVKVIWTRAEDYKDEKFDVLTARAVAYIDKLLKFTYHLVKNNGYFVLYKLFSDSEYNDILLSCKKYNLELVGKYEYKLYDDDILRVIYILKKKS